MSHYRHPPKDPATLLANLAGLSAVDCLIFDRVVGSEAGPLIGVTDRQLEAALRPHLSPQLIHQRLESLWKHGLIRCRVYLGVIFYQPVVTP